MMLEIFPCWSREESGWFLLYPPCQTGLCFICKVIVVPTCALNGPGREHWEQNQESLVASSVHGAVFWCLAGFNNKQCPGAHSSEEQVTSSCTPHPTPKLSVPFPKAALCSSPLPGAGMPLNKTQPAKIKQERTENSAAWSWEHGPGVWSCPQPWLSPGPPVPAKAWKIPHPRGVWMLLPP